MAGWPVERQDPSETVGSIEFTQPQREQHLQGGNSMNKSGVLRGNCENQDRMGLAWPKCRELGALDQGGGGVETQTSRTLVG